MAWSASKLLKARLKSSTQQNKPKRPNVSFSKKSSTAASAAATIANQSSRRLESPKRLGTPPPETTFTGLPWSVRSQGSKYRPSRLRPVTSHHGIYTYLYSDVYDGEEKARPAVLPVPLTLHHYQTDAPGPIVSAKPAFAKSRHLSHDQDIVQHFTGTSKELTIVERGHNDPYKYRLDNKLIHGYDQLTEDSMRSFLGNSGFLPTASTELLELYRAMGTQGQRRQAAEEHQQESGNGNQQPAEDSAAVAAVEESEAAAAVVAFTGSEPARTKAHEELIRIYGNKLVTKIIRGERRFPPGYRKEDLIRKEPLALQRPTEGKPTPEPEPHPDTFKNPKIRISLAVQRKLIQKQLDEEKRLANPKMDARAYDRRRRVLLNAAMKAYESDNGKATDELLVDLVDIPADKVLYHNIDLENMKKPAEASQFEVGNDSDSELDTEHHTPLTSTTAVAGHPHRTATIELGLKAPQPSAAIDASKELKSIFGVKSDIEPSALNFFKGKSVAGSLIRQLEAENPHHFAPPPNIVLLPTTPFSRRFVSQKTIRTREIARQTLAKHSAVKKKHLDSLQRPKQMRLIAKP